jgi:branched-chain amino acid transport system substrate-binding protein
MRKSRLLILLLAASMVGFACSSSKKAATATSTTAAGGTATTAASSFKLTSPMLVVGLWDIQGENSFALNDLNNGATMAIADLNAAGGGGGLPVQFKRAYTPSYDPSLTAPGVRLGVSMKPTVLIGPGTAGSSIIAAPIVGDAHIPTMLLGQTDKVQLHGGSGNQWVFTDNPTGSSAAEDAVKFLVENLHKSKLGLLCVSLSYCTDIVPALTKAATSAGGNIAIQRTYAFNATDMTQQDQAMEQAKVDAVINWGYQGPMVLQLKQFQQDNFNVPTLGAAATADIVGRKLVTGSQIQNLYGVQNCNPVADTRPIATKFVAEYKAKYGVPPTVTATISYDAVFIMAEAVKLAQSTDAQAVDTALTKVQYSGVCDPAYKADEEHNFAHQNTIISFANGDQTTAATYTVPPSTSAGS